VCHLRYTTQTHLVTHTIVVNVHLHWHFISLDVICSFVFIPWWILRFRLSGFTCIIRRNNCSDPPRWLESHSNKEIQKVTINKNATFEFRSQRSFFSFACSHLRNNCGVSTKWHLFFYSIFL